MIAWLESWIGQIIIAVIITIIIEMILPNGNNKKYIKMVLGIYVLFTIIGPIISVATNEESNIFEFDYKKYFNSEISNSEELDDFEEKNSKLLIQNYIEEIKNDIISKIEKKGYTVININLSIVGNKESKNYGNISKIIISVSDKTTETSNSTIKIGNIQINNNVAKKNENNEISEKEKQDIIKFIMEEYNIDDKNIIQID